MQAVKRGENKLDYILVKSLASKNSASLILKGGAKIGLSEDGVVRIVAIIDAEFEVGLLRLGDGVRKGPHESAEGDV